MISLRNLLSWENNLAADELLAAGYEICLSLQHGVYYIAIKGACGPLGIRNFTVCEYGRDIDMAFMLAWARVGMNTDLWEKK